MKSKDSGKMGEAYRQQDKAPRKGVKADDADEYSAGSSDFSKLYVEKGKAFSEQAKAPQGRGNRGPSQDDGPPVSYWDKSTPKSKAYEEQCHWGDSDNNQAPSMGFKFSGPGSEYLGHFKQDKNLRQGHNDGPNMNMDGISDGLGMMAANSYRDPIKKDQLQTLQEEAGQSRARMRNENPGPSPMPKNNRGKNLEETATKFFDKFKK